MHKPLPRRRELTLRIFTYAVMTAVVLAAVAVCLFVVLGYSVDQKTGQAKQGGLLQFRSFPASAEVTVDGVRQSARTPSKMNISSSSHTVAIKRDDYRSWSKDFTLKHGELLWLNARLVPQSITTTEAWQFEAISSTKASPNKKWYAAIEKADSPMLKIFDLSDEKKPKATQLKIPASALQLSSENDSFRIAEWDFGSRYILVSHSIGPAVEWLRVDRTDAEKTVNITTKLNLQFSQAHFIGNSGNLLYALSSDGSLRRLDVGAATVSRPIAAHVREFQLYKDDRVAIVSQDTETQTASVYRDGAKKPVLLRRVTSAAPPLRLDLSSYFEDDYAALAYGQTVDIIKDPFDKQKKVASLELPGLETTWVYFSNNGQFVVAQTKATLASYDIERGDTFNFVVPADSAYNPADHLEWLDDFRLWSDAGGSLVITEFDGTNQQTIANLTPGGSVTLSDNGKRLFSISTNTATKKPVLQSSVMVVEQ